MQKISTNFFRKDVLELAPNLIGKIIVRNFPDNSSLHLKILETEAYCGTDDLACHASKGRTKRTDVMYHEGGTIYMYLIYGMYWMFNIVSGEINNPQAVLIRCAGDFNGPGKLTKALKMDKSFNGEHICKSDTIYIADDNYTPKIITKKRVGIDYAGEEWANKLWRFVLKA
jgi:DNA-3-methyladenine glycosylase